MTLVLSESDKRDIARMVREEEGTLDLLTEAQTAGKLNVTLPTLYKLGLKKISLTKGKGSIRYRRSDIEEFLDSREVRA